MAQFPEALSWQVVVLSPYDVVVQCFFFTLGSFKGGVDGSFVMAMFNMASIFLVPLFIFLQVAGWGWIGLGSVGHL